MVLVSFFFALPFFEGSRRARAAKLKLLVEDALGVGFQFFGRDFEHFAVSPDADRQAEASMLDDNFFDGNPEGHGGPFFQGKVEHVLRGLGHGVRNEIPVPRMLL